MFEIKVSIVAPEMVEAINNLVFVIRDRNAVKMTGGTEAAVPVRNFFAPAGANAARL